MAKNFSRYTMRANMLRKVLIRIDYDGVTDINEWIKLFKENDELSSYFQKIHKGSSESSHYITFKYGRNCSIPFHSIKYISV